MKASLPEKGQQKQGRTDWIIFLSTLILLALCTTPLLYWPTESQSLLGYLKNWIENNFGSVYQFLAIAVLIFVGWIAFGKYGSIRMGDESPRFGTYSWASMLFCAGVATGILYWGSIEWAYYVDSPPFGLEPGSTLAIEYAATYGIFHWGFVGWAFYSLPAVAIGYVYFVEKNPVLRLSAACGRLLGRHANGLIGQTLDVLFMIGLLGSTGTSLGLGTPMIAAGVAEIFSIPDSFSLKLLIILFCSFIFSVSVYMGLGKGIRRLSNFNTVTAFAFLAFIFLVGPTVFILKMSLNSLGILTQEFIRMLTWTDPLTDSRFVEDWSIFYWAWWVAVGPFMGIFIAKISAGRTIRQIILGTVVFGSLGSALFYCILGNYALNLELTGQLAILEMVRAEQPAQAIISIINSAAPGKSILVVFCLMSLVFMATSFDSTSYTLATVATRHLRTDQDPDRWQRLFWAFTLVLLPIALMYVGGLESLKLAVLVSALPLVVIYVMMGISLFKNLREHKSR